MAVMVMSVVVSAGAIVRIVMSALAAMFMVVTMTTAMIVIVIVIVTIAMIVMAVLGQMSGGAVIFHSRNCPTVDRMSAGAETRAQNTARSRAPRTIPQKDPGNWHPIPIFAAAPCNPSRSAPRDRTADSLRTLEAEFAQ
jgi:hypothetical protein